MKQDQAIKELPLMNKFEAMVLIKINKENPPSYAHMIQETMLSKEKSSSSEGRRQRFMLEYLFSEYPLLKNDVDGRRHATLLSQELKELNQRKVLSFITNVEDQSDHHHYIVQATVYMIQEAKLSKEESSPEGGSQLFTSEYISSKYLPLKNNDVDRHHTTLLRKELTQRKVVLSLIINVEDQSANHCILEDTLYCENTGAERPTIALHLLLLFLYPANYPQVVAQQPQGGRDEEDNCNIGIMEKKTRKLKYKSVREIDRRMVDGIEGTWMNVDVEIGVFDDDQVTKIEKDSFRRTDMNTVDDPKDDDGKDVVREEEYQEEVREKEEEEGQEQELEEVKDQEEADEDECDEECVLGNEGEAIGQEEEEEYQEEEVGEEDEDEDEDEDDDEEEEKEEEEDKDEDKDEEDEDEDDEDEDEDLDDFQLLEKVREMTGITAAEEEALVAEDEDDKTFVEDVIKTIQRTIERTEKSLHTEEVNAKEKAAAAKAKEAASKAATEAVKAAREAVKAATEAAKAATAEAQAASRELVEAQAAVKATKKHLREAKAAVTALTKAYGVDDEKS